MESKSLTKGVTHVVAEHMLTDKVFMAYETNIPVMSTKWIDAVWEDSQNQVVNAIDQQYVKYACPIFHNMIICVSQVSPGLKEALRNVIEANGKPIQFYLTIRAIVTNVGIILISRRPILRGIIKE